MLLLEKMAHRHITSANYITSVNGMVHPDRILPEHDFLYMLEGDWEIMEDGHIYEIHQDDLLILGAGRHHYGKKLCNPGNRHMYFHVLPTSVENGKKNNMEEMESSTLFPCHTLLHCQNTMHIRRYFEELLSAYWSDSPLTRWWRKSAGRYSQTPRFFILPGKWQTRILSVPAPSTTIS